MRSAAFLELQPMRATKRGDADTVKNTDRTEFTIGYGYGHGHGYGYVDSDPFAVEHVTSESIAADALEAKCRSGAGILDCTRAYIPASSTASLRECGLEPETPAASARPVGTRTPESISDLGKFMALLCAETKR